MVKKNPGALIPLGAFGLAMLVALLSGSAIIAAAEGDCINYVLNKIVGNPVGDKGGIKVQANVTGTVVAPWTDPRATPSEMRVIVPFTYTTTGGGKPVKTDVSVPFSIPGVKNLGEEAGATTTTYDVVAIIDMEKLKDAVKANTGVVDNGNGTKTEKVASGQAQWTLVIDVRGTAKKNVSGVQFCQGSGTFNRNINELKPSK